MDEEIDAFVWHDLDGAIVAVGQVSPGRERQVEAATQPHQRVVKVRVQEKQLDKLHLTHSIDVTRGILCVRSDSPRESRPGQDTNTGR